MPLDIIIKTEGYCTSGTSPSPAADEGRHWPPRERGWGEGALLQTAQQPHPSAPQNSLPETGTSDAQALACSWPCTLQLLAQPQATDTFCELRLPAVLIAAEEFHRRPIRRRRRQGRGER